MRKTMKAISQWLTRWPEKTVMTMTHHFQISTPQMKRPLSVRTTRLTTSSARKRTSTASSSERNDLRRHLAEDAWVGAASLRKMSSSSSASAGVGGAVAVRGVWVAAGWAGEAWEEEGAGG